MCKLQDYLNAQIKEIEKYKWIKSEKCGYDVGVLGEIEWVERYAKKFREYMIKNYGEVE